MFISAVKLGILIWGSMGIDSLLEASGMYNEFFFLRKKSSLNVLKPALFIAAFIDRLLPLAAHHRCQMPFFPPKRAQNNTAQKHHENETRLQLFLTQRRPNPVDSL